MIPPSRCPFSYQISNWLINGRRMKTDSLKLIPRTGEFERYPDFAIVGHTTELTGCCSDLRISISRNRKHYSDRIYTVFVQCLRADEGQLGNSAWEVGLPERFILERRFRQDFWAILQN